MSSRYFKKEKWSAKLVWPPSTCQKISTWKNLARVPAGGKMVLAGVNKWRKRLWEESGDVDSTVRRITNKNGLRRTWVELIIDLKLLSWAHGFTLFPHFLLSKANKRGCSSYTFGGKIWGLVPFTPLNPKMTALIRDNCKRHLQALSQEDKGSIVCPYWITDLFLTIFVCWAGMVNISKTPRESFTCGIWNPGLWNREYIKRNPESHYWLESRTHVPLAKNDESSTRNPESMEWNPTSKTVLDML